MARTASLDASPWLPAYGWWPRRSEYSVAVLLLPYHVAVDPEAQFAFAVRGYAGSREPVWEHELGPLGLDEQAEVQLDDLDLPEPPEQGGILEVHAMRLDKGPRHTVAFNGMWIDARGRSGGGYLIPTVPMRAAAKAVARDDLQVVPGILADGETHTELVLLNVSPETTAVRLVASNADGLVSESESFDMGPWSAWHGNVADHVPRLRRLLGASDGLGSLAIYSTHKILPYFGFARAGQPVVSMDHTAPIFGTEYKPPVATMVLALDEDVAALGRFLDSVEAQEVDGPVEVLAIDAGASPAAAELAEQRGARVHRAPEAGNGSVALDLVAGEFVLLADTRVVPQHGRWLSRLMGPLRRDPQLDAVFGRQLADDPESPQGRALDAVFGEAGRPPEAFDPQRTSAETALFANAAVRRSALEELPVAAGAAAETAWRRRLTGRRVGYQPKAPVRRTG